MIWWSEKYLKRAQSNLAVVDAMRCCSYLAILYIFITLMSHAKIFSSLFRRSWNLRDDKRRLFRAHNDYLELIVINWTIKPATATNEYRTFYSASEIQEFCAVSSAMLNSFGWLAGWKCVQMLMREKLCGGGMWKCVNKKWQIRMKTSKTNRK